jgi:predicted RND superfamily exporter protein
MKTFAQKVLKWRVPIIISTVCITIFFGFGMTRLTINSDITSYLKPDDEVMVLFNRIGDEYGGNQIVMVAVKSDDVVTLQGLSFIRDLAEKYAGVEGVATVTSLLNIVDIKDTGYGLEVGKLIDKDKIPKTEQELNKLRRYILSKDTYRGKIISEDGSTTLIICKLNPQYNKVEVTKNLIEITESPVNEYEIFYSGYPVQIIDLSSYIANDLKTLIPAVFVMILLVLFFSFRTVRGVLCPLAIVIISTIWTMGILGYTDTPLTVLSNVIPVILLALGTAYGIHFLARYYEDVSVDSNRLSDIQKTLRHIGVPILLTALTTIAGFLSFTGAYITAISEFGIYTAFGVLFAMILSLTFLPAVLSFLKVKPMVLAKGEKEHVLARIMKGSSGFILKNERKIIFAGLFIAVLSLIIIPRIKPETAIINFFPKKSEIRKADTIIKETFGGSTTINVAVEGDMKSAQVLKKILLLEKYLEHLPHVQNSQSLADLIARMNDTLNGVHTIPETREEVANLLFLLEGEDILGQMVNADYTEGIVSATFGSLDSKVLKHTIRMIEEYIDTNINGTHLVLIEKKPGGAEYALVEEWKYDYLSRALSYDLHSYGGGSGIDPAVIEETIKEIYEEQTELLYPEREKELRHDLTLFFEEESAVYIKSAADIDNTVDALVAYAGGEQTGQGAVNALLEAVIPDHYYAGYPKSIPDTGEFVYAKILSAQNESKIARTSNLFIETLLPEHSGDKDLAKRVGDDIWVLTEMSGTVDPARIGEGGEYETIRMDGSLTGMIKIVQRLNESLIRSQVQSILIAIIVVFIILSSQFKSAKMGAVVLSPIVLVILINFALMGYLGIPLDYATMLVGSIIIGVGIDYSIHFSSRYKIEYRETHDERKALEKTLKTTGTAIISNALMVSLGFFVLVGGKFIPVKREGWMIGVLMIISAFAALVYLPSLILTLKRFLKLNDMKPGTKGKKQ